MLCPSMYFSSFVGCCTVPARFPTEVGPLVGIVTPGHILFQCELGCQPLGLDADMHVRRRLFFIYLVYVHLPNHIPWHISSLEDDPRVY